MSVSVSDKSDERAIGWYVHLPFCPTKCGYCDFYSLPTRPEMIGDLVRAVCREMELRDPGRPVRSVFVGGGTPTVLPAEALERVLRAVPGKRQNVETSKRRNASEEPPRPPLGKGGSVEFTVEANPSSADELKLELLRRCGVNRVSFGAQSFHRDDLAVLERLHNPAHIAEAVRLARRAEFENINLDLIFGIPGQTVGRWLDSLGRAIDLGVEHIACYSLMYEEGTALTKRRRMGLVEPCDEDAEAEMFERTIDVLTGAGYEHYEISNYARAGRRCEHNLIYWRNEEYVGVGPSAVSYLDGVRRKNVADVGKYVAGVLHGEEGNVESSKRRNVEIGMMNPPGPPFVRGAAILEELVIERESLGGEARARETAIQMLRLSEGMGLADFLRRTGFDAMVLFAEPIERFGASGHVEVHAGRVRLTRRGLMVANRVMMEFLGPAEAGSDEAAARLNQRVLAISVPPAKN